MIRSWFRRRWFAKALAAARARRAEREAEALRAELMDAYVNAPDYATARLLMSLMMSDTVRRRGAG